MKSPHEIRELILYLLDLKKSSAHKMLTECGYNTSLVNDLKKGQMPAADKIAAIANYLGVSTDYLLGNQITQTSLNSQNNQDSTNIAGDIVLTQTLANEEFIKDLRAAFYGDKIKELTPEDKEQLIEMAKMIAKVRGKSNPKKPRNPKNKQSDEN